MQVPKNASAIHVRMVEHAYLAYMTTVASALPVSLVNSVNSKVCGDFCCKISPYL